MTTNVSKGFDAAGEDESGKTAAARAVGVGHRAEDEVRYHSTVGRQAVGSRQRTF